jgi:hypothetical protein
MDRTSTCLYPVDDIVLDWGRGKGDGLEDVFEPFADLSHFLVRYDSKVQDRPGVYTEVSSGVRKTQACLTICKTFCTTIYY